MESLPYTEARERLVRDALRRHVALILVFGAVFGAAGAWIVSKQPHEYTSEAKVLIRPTTGNALSPDSATSGQRVTVAMVTESALVDSPAVATGVAKTLGVSTDTAVKAMNATVPPNTQLVSIKYTATTADAAEKGAQAFADAYLAYRKGLSEAVVKGQLAGLTAQEKDVSSKLKAAGTAAAVTDAKPDANAQVQLYAGRLATIQNNIASVTATDTNSGAIVDPPDVPPVTTSIIEKALIPVAVLIGLVFGFVVALWLERRDDRIRGATEHNLFGAPLLTAVPGKAGGPRRVTSGGDDRVSESYRRARAGVLASRGSKGSVFGVVGATNGMPVGDVALNLGSTLARSGYTTAVVDATAGGEDLAAMAKVLATTGFSDALKSADTAADVSSLAVRTNGIDLVAAGDDSAGSRDLFHSEQMRSTVAALSSAHDFTLLAGAGITTAEGSGVAIAADSVIVVVEDRRTTHSALAQAMQRCVEVGAPVLGIIVVPASSSRWRGRRTHLAPRHERPQTSADTNDKATHTATAKPVAADSADSADSSDVSTVTSVGS